MDPLFHLLIVVLVFAIVAYGLYWVCERFRLPVVVLWLVGGILLIIILMFARDQVGVLKFR